MIDHSRDELLNGLVQTSLSSLTPIPAFPSANPSVSSFSSSSFPFVFRPIPLRPYLALTSLNSLRCFQFLRSSSRYAARKFLVSPLAWRSKKTPIFMRPSSIFYNASSRSSLATRANFSLASRIILPTISIKIPCFSRFETKGKACLPFSISSKGDGFSLRTKNRDLWIFRSRIIFGRIGSLPAKNSLSCRCFFDTRYYILRTRLHPILPIPSPTRSTKRRGRIEINNNNTSNQERIKSN